MTDTSVADTATTTTTTSTATAALTAPPPPFHESFTDAGLKEWAGKSGFKSAEEVAALAHKFDAFKETDPASLVAIPKDADTKAHMALLERLGAPKEASAYALDKIEGADAPTAEWASGVFQKAGILPWQAQLIASEQVKFMAAQQEAVAKADKADGERELALLRTEWGGEAEAKFEAGRRALRVASQQAGVPAEKIGEFVAFIEQGAGSAVALKMAAFFGSLIKESDFIDGKQTTQGDSILQRLYPNDVAKDRGAR